MKLGRSGVEIMCSVKGEVKCDRRILTYLALTLFNSGFLFMFWQIFTYLFGLNVRNIQLLPEGVISIIHGARFENGAH